MIIRFYVRKKDKRVFITVTLAVFIALTAISVYAVLSGEQDYDDSIYIGKAITHIETENKIYTVCTVLNESPEEHELDLYLEVCEGFGIKTVFFISPDVLKQNGDAIGLITSKGHSLGLYVQGTCGMSRSDFMRFLAKCNDDFHSITGRYPKYCVSDKTPSVHMADTVRAYGQYYIGFGVDVNKKGDDIIKAGDILKADISKEEYIYTFAKVISAALKKQLKAVSMKEFILEYEGITES